MKRYGDSGKGMQFTSAKRGSQKDAPFPYANDNPPGKPPLKSRAGYSTHSESFDAPIHQKDWKPQRERIRNGGGTKTSIDSTYGRGANDGSKDSPRKKVW